MRIFTIAFFLLLCEFAGATAYVWNGSASTAWGLNTNWTPNTGTPGVGDDVTINAGAAFQPVMSANVIINNFTITGGTLDLGGQALTILGTSVFTAGTINNGSVAPSGSSATFTNTTFGATVSASCAAIQLNGGTFNSASSFNFSGSGTNYCSSGATYNADVTFTMSGSGNFMTGYYGGTNTYNGNITVNITGTGQLSFGQSAGTHSLAATKTIILGGSGVSSGTLDLCGFIQADATALNLTTTGTANVNIRRSTWTGTVTISSPRIYTIENSTFNAAASFTKTGASDDYSGAGNTFNSTATFSNTGTGWLHTNYYNGTTLFNDNVFVNNTGTGGIGFGWGYPSYTGAMQLAAGKTIQIGGSGVSSGNLALARFTQSDATTQNLTLSGTAVLYIKGCTWTGLTNFTSPRIYSIELNTFNAAASFTKTGASDDYSSSGNTFNSTVTFSNSGTGWMHLFYYNGTTTFNDNVFVNNTGTGGIGFGWGYPSYTGAINFAAGKTIQIGGSGVTSGGLALGRITQSAATAQSLTTTGTSTLYMKGCTWTGVVDFTSPRIYDIEQNTFNAAASFTKTGASDDYSGSGNIYNSTVTFTNTGTGWLQLDYYNGSTNYNDNIIVNCTGSAGITFGWGYPGYTGTNTLAPGKVIQVGGTGFTSGTLGLGRFAQADATTLTLTLGSGANISSRGSTWTGPLVWTAGGINIQRTTCNNTANFTKTGAYDSYAESGNTFNGVTTINMEAAASWHWNYYDVSTTTFNDNIVVTNTSTGGIYFGWGYTTSCTTQLAAGKVISVGGAGFNTGTLGLGQFTQADATTLNITLGTSARLSSNRSTWTGILNWTAGGITVGRSTFNNTANFTKTGSFDDYMESGNVFNAVTYINMQGTASWHWNYYDVSTSVFNDNIVVTNTSTGGIYFGWGYTTACSTQLAAGKVISVGGAGFNTGTLGLGQFTQADATTLTITLGTSARLSSNRSTWTGILNWTAGGITIGRSTCNNAANFTKTGSFDDYMESGNVFNGVTSINMQGTASWHWNYYDVSTSVFNDNIVVTNISTGGIYFGWGYTTACTTQLAAGKVINVGGAGFISGTLGLGQVTQADATTLNLTLTGTSGLYLRRSTFTGAVNFTAPAIRTDNTTYNGVAAFDFTGPGTTYNDNGNTYNSASSFTMSGTGTWHMSYYNSYASDDYNATATFLRTGTGQLYPCYNNNNTLSGDISTTGTTYAITFGINGGTTTMDGTSAQAINGASATQPTFRILTIDNTSTGVTLNTPVTISSTLNLTNGALTLNANRLTVTNAATAAIGRTNGYIISENTSNLGKVQWNMGSTTGAHVFPFGSAAGSYIPMTLNLTAGTIGNVTVSTYPTAADNTPFPSSPHVVTQVGNLLENSANVVDRFWQIDKTGASGTATLTFTATAAEVGTLTNLIAEHWNTSTTKWDNYPISGCSYSNTAYSATISGVTSFSPWTMSGNNKPLPIELLYFTAHLNSNNKVDLNWSTAAEVNNEYFTIERSSNGTKFYPIEKVKGAGNSSTKLDYFTIDKEPLNGISYYRLKQTDYNGNYSYSNVAVIEIKSDKGINVFPTVIGNNRAITIQYLNDITEELVVVLRDVAGKEISNDVLNVNTGTASMNIPSSLSAGIYTLTGTSGNIFFTRKIIIQ